MGSAVAAVSGKIKCLICGEETHAIQVHLKEKHPGIAVEEYSRMYPDAPLLSELAQRKIEEKKQEQLRMNAAVAVRSNVTPLHASATTTKPLHELFGLGNAPAAMNAKGQPIMITVLEMGQFADMIPPVDADYVFDIDILKNALMGMELNIAMFNHGHAGVGKTTLPEQICARTNRPMIRVQHTLGMEERDVVGMWVVKGGDTVWQPGPLQMAMRYGWVYLADEYDYGMSGVNGLYQPVLEGKSLVTKDAPEEWRVVKPHPHFRFVATGNTNGAGDDTGLYTGTNMGNAANYERFGIMQEFTYLAPELEAQILVKKVGIQKAHADRLVSFANKIRNEFAAQKISHTISPRSLLFAASLGIRRGSWTVGLKLAFINRLSRVDREVATQLAQREFDSQ